MYTYPMTGDGKPGILATSAHLYGFWWNDQKDANTFVQRKLFLDPFEVAKISTTVKLSGDEKTLYDAITKVRTDHFKRSPFAVNPALCKLARDHAERAADDDPEAKIKHAYTGQLLVFKSMRFAKPADEKVKKDQLTALQKFALSLLPDNEKDKHLVLPGFEIGVGSAKTKRGETQYTLAIGDRKQFSLPSQTHALQMVDIDGDGLPDLVTGRRWWAHGPRGDAGPNDPAYLYWFQAQRGKDGTITFIPHMIDDDSGVGTSFAIADINGDGLPDVIVSNKKGVHVFLQQR
ncbi:MAG: VCBS repeat-containing protein [Planctomycetes bacterium]|nr:VCBS repeat-containing protein [Planctomycetota bacterium]